MGDFSDLGFPLLRSEIMASSSSTSVVCSSSLTDDILLEIFTNLPLKSISKLKCLSKVWLSNFSDPNFIIKWFRTNNKSLPWIQYHSVPYQGGNPLRVRYAYPELHSEFMTSNEHLFSLKFLIDKKPFQGAKVFTLGSSNGFLLCYSFHSEYQKRYHVCNPLTQKWVSLPSPPGSRISNLDVNGIYSEYSSSFTSCCFWIVRIPTFHVPSKKFNVDMFSSDLGVWQSFQVLCDKDVRWSRSTYANTVILNGVLFWIDGLGKMLAYNFIKNSGSDGHRCSLIDLPDDGDGDVFESILGDSEGWLCYGRIRITDEELTMSVWVLNDVNWKIMHKNISLGPVFVELTNVFARIRVLGFSPVDRNVVLLGWTQKVWGFNVQTRSVDELSLGNAYDYDLGKPYLPFVLKPMPTVLPICRSNPEVKKRKKKRLTQMEWKRQ